MALVQGQTNQFMLALDEAESSLNLEVLKADSEETSKKALKEKLIMQEVICPIREMTGRECLLMYVGHIANQPALFEVRSRAVSLSNWSVHQGMNSVNPYASPF
jgi:hypothetical protein